MKTISNLLLCIFAGIGAGALDVRFDSGVLFLLALVTIINFLYLSEQLK